MKDETIKVFVFITDNATGETMQCCEEVFVEDGEPLLYYWQEGNCSCDCNRRLYFNRAKFKEWNMDDDNLGCSDGLYSVKIYDMNMNLLWDEKEDSK